MGEYIIPILALILFVFLIWFFVKIFVKKKTSEKPSKPDVEPKKEEKKDAEKPKNDIPDILKEVTLGNYMYDIAHEQEDINVEDIPENGDIEADTKTVEEAFYRIESIDVDEDENLDVRSILDEVDGTTRANKPEFEEIKGLSKRTKAILISDILNKNKK